MGRPKVLLLGEIEHADKPWNDLKDLADLVLPESANREAFIQECKTGKLDGVVCIYRTFHSITITGLFDDELVGALPSSVKSVSHVGAGYDQIDVYACTKHGISVSNTPTAVDDATADTNLFLILGALRGFNTALFSLRQGNWRGIQAPPLGHDPQGKVLGILGMGGIGRSVKRKAEALGMTVQYFNRKELTPELAAGAKYVSFEELLTSSDVLSLNLPLNKNTRHIISTAEFAKMKKGVVIVNTARGAVLDEAALVKALDEGIVWSVGLDVFEEEPTVHPGLIANPNVMLLPHMGTYTVETQTKMEERVIMNIRSMLEKGELVNLVPEQVKVN